MYSSASIDVKTVSPDLLPQLWHIAESPLAAQWRLRYAKVAETMARTANIRHLVIHFSRL
jgi:hypothetical protein